MLDLVIAVPALLVASPLVCVIAIAIRLTMGKGRTGGRASWWEMISVRSEAFTKRCWQPAGCPPGRSCGMEGRRPGSSRPWLPSTWETAAETG